MNEQTPLQKEANAVATAFTLIAQSNHPGNQADSVLLALKYLDEKHTELTKAIEAAQPASEAIIESTPVEQQVNVV